MSLFGTTLHFALLGTQIFLFEPHSQTTIPDGPRKWWTGHRERYTPPGNLQETVRLLLEAGARPNAYWNDISPAKLALELSCFTGTKNSEAFVPFIHQLFALEDDALRFFH